MMFGIWKTDVTNIGRFNWWIGECLLVAEALVGVLSFGHLAADWRVWWIDYHIRKKRK